MSGVVMLTGMLMVLSKMGAMRTMIWVLMPLFLRTRMTMDMAVANMDIDGIGGVTVITTDHSSMRPTYFTIWRVTFLCAGRWSN